MTTRDETVARLEELADAERAILLDPCVCGHTLNDHGDLGGCWLCGEEEGDADCWVTCEALMVERVGRIVAARTATHLADVTAERDAAVRVHRDLTRRLGFGDNITEPQADNDTVVEFIDAAVMAQNEHQECAMTCEPCGERLAETTCPHCHGSGGNNALINATGAYSECEWCAGVGKVHEGCVEKGYAELVAERDAAVGKVARVEALAAKWDQDRKSFPVATDDNAAYAEVAVRLCGEELRTALAPTAEDRAREGSL